MIKFTRNILSNGLTVLCNTDTDTPFVSVNILYKVGSRNESAEKTGFAHLFEHLMFGGSVHVPDFDREVQIAGGESNAYTNNDYTNYYITIPAANIETALWLESDRMSGLNISQHALDIQKSVVVEEFKQRYLNSPYGDVWLHLRPLAYEIHPYRWPTIGMSAEHITDASLNDVQAFFQHHYTPDNAIISISGNISEERALELVKKWFEDIPGSKRKADAIPQEPQQTKAKRLTLSDRHVPADAIYKVYHMGARCSEDFYICDIISDVLSSGQSSRLYINLIKNRGLFSNIDAYITDDIDPGLFVFSGKLSDGIHIEEAEQAILQEIESFISDPLTERELQKTINKTDARISYSKISYQSKATNLAFFEYLGDVNLINTEREKYVPITVDQIKAYARRLFRPENSSTLLYLK